MNALSWCGSIHTAVVITVCVYNPKSPLALLFIWIWHWNHHWVWFSSGEEILPQKNYTQVFALHYLEVLWEMFDSMLWQISLFLSGLPWKVFSLPTHLVGSQRVPLFHVSQTVPVWACQAELFMIVLAAFEQIERLNYTKSSETVLESSTALVSI